jgi:hypothetical protein
MAEESGTTRRPRLSDLIIDRDLTDEEITQIRQRVDTLVARFDPTKDAHHHDSVKLV